MAQLQNGSYRNHCEPVGVDFRPAKGLMVVHRCLLCSFIRPNRVAPDDLEAVIRLMQRG